MKSTRVVLLTVFSAACLAGGFAFGGTSPSAPTNVSASDATLSSGVQVSWDAVEGAVAYEVYRSTEFLSDSAKLCKSVAGTRFLDMQAVAGTTYYYFVKAVAADGGKSDFSPFDEGSRKSGSASTYLVVDLQGAAAGAVSELSDVPAGGWSDEYKTTKLVMRRIEAGSFTMGSPESEVGRYASSEAQKEVTLAKPFYIGVFEVTQKQYELLTGSGTGSTTTKGDMRPMETVNRTTLLGNGGFVAKLCAKTGMAFDLPIEAQWEYACRAGTTTALNNGTDLTSEKSDDNMNDVGCYAYNYTADKGGYTSGHKNVGSYAPNAWGLYDMHGNVAEWCQDDVTVKIDEYLSYEAGVVRGGGWKSVAKDCRSARRATFSPDGSIPNTVGFRLSLAESVPTVPVEQGTIVLVAGEENTYVVSNTTDTVDISNLPSDATVRLDPSVDTVTGVTDVKQIKVVAVSTDKYGDTLADITSAFNITGSSEIQITLNPSASVTYLRNGESTPVTIPVTPVFADSDDTVGMIAVSTNSVQVGVKTIPGLKYQVIHSATPYFTSQDKVGEPVRSQSSCLAIKMEKTEASSAFYKVEVTK